VEVALVEYMEMMQAIKHLITFTQLHLKVVEITQKKLDTFQEWNSKVGMAKVVQETKS